MSFVITRLLALDDRPGSLLYGRIEPDRIAVAGTPTAPTALATAYDSRFRDRRVGAAVILSGAEMTGMGAFPARGPPLLAMQGTADAINDPGLHGGLLPARTTTEVPGPPAGASHRPPYTSEEPQLGIVERVTIAFLDHYLRGTPAAPAATSAAARNAGLSTLSADA